MIDRDELKALIDAELKKDIVDEEVSSEEAVDEEVSEPVSESEVKDVEVKEEIKDEVDPVLAEAISMGYDPNYSGANKKTPEQFVRDGSFFRKIDAQKKELQELKGMMKQQIEHTRKVEKAAAEKALRETQQEKIARVNEGDVEGYKIAEQKEAAIREQMQATQPPVPETPDEIKEWAKTNETWFNMNSKENTRMANAADALFRLSEQEASDEGVTRTTKEHLKFVDERMKTLFPTKFSNPNKERPAAVGKSTVSSGKKLDLSSKLTDRQRQYVKQAREHGLDLSYEEYANQLKLTGDLRDE